MRSQKKLSKRNDGSNHRRTESHRQMFTGPVLSLLGRGEDIVLNSGRR